MSAPSPLPGEPLVPSPRRRSRWFRWGVALLLIAGLGYGGLWLYGRDAAERRYREALEQADRLDPGWRLGDLLARRPAVNSAENSAPLIQSVHDRVPADWPAKELSDAFEPLWPNERLDVRTLALLERELKRLPAGVVEDARRLAEMSRGQFGFQWSGKNWLPGRSEGADFLQFPRRAAATLYWDGIRLADEGRLDEALGNCRAILNAGRSLDGEPHMIAALVRIACQHQAVSLAEQVLAQGEPSEAALRATEELFAEEGNGAILLEAVRGERALFDACLSGIREGLIQSDDLPQEAANKTTHARALTRFTEMIELLKSQPARPLAALREYVAEREQLVKERVQPDRLAPDRELAGEVLTVLAMGSIPRIAESVLASQTRCRCAAVALAAERFRRTPDHPRWPSRPAELVPDFLATWPADPVNAEPLRWLPVEGGLVIYGVGRDEKDDGGQIDSFEPTGTDAGFRLFDPELRRQPPPIPEPLPDPKPLD